MDDEAWAASALRASAEASARAADSSASLQEQQSFTLHLACPGVLCSIQEQAVCTAAPVQHCTGLIGPMSHLMAHSRSSGALTSLRDTAAVRAQRIAPAYLPSGRAYTGVGCRLPGLDCDSPIGSEASCMQPRVSPARAAGLCDVDVQVLRQCVSGSQLQGALNDALCLLGTGAHAAVLLQGG